MVNSGYTERNWCDRCYPGDDVWKEAAESYMVSARRAGTRSLLASLALGQVSSCPLDRPKVDAHRTEFKRGIGGWVPLHNSIGKLNTWLSP